MRNAYRAIRLALRYPLSLAAAVGLTFVVAALWGGNIAAVYPILEVAFQGESLQDWSAQKIAKSEAAIAELQLSIAALRKKNPQLPEERSRWQYELDSQSSRLAAEQEAPAGCAGCTPGFKNTCRGTPSKPWRSWWD